MIDALTNWVAAHAAEMLLAFIVTGTMALASQFDSMVKDAGKDSPLWLRILSRVVSQLARNVGKAANDPKAQAKVRVLALVALVPLVFACTTIEPDTLSLSYGTNEAYNVSGPSLEVSADGGITCTSPDPVNYPCRAQYAAGWEAWEQVIKALGIPFEAVLQLFGRSLIPAAS